METNKTILLRAVISIGDRKTVGTVRDFRVDYDNQAISHYVLESAPSYDLSLLPQDKVLAIGDTFATIHKSSDLIAGEHRDARSILAEKNRLVGLDVFSQTGNRLGFVEGFSFNASSGKILEFTMNDGSVFGDDDFLFFSSEYVFVNYDGTSATIADDEAAADEALELEAQEEAEEVAEVEVPEVEEEPEAEVQEEAEEVAEVEVPEVEEEPEAEEVAEVEVPEVEEEPEAPADEEDVAEEESEEISALRDLLVGAVLNTDVDKDGFFVEKGTEITSEIFDDALAHDAVLLLTISIDF